MSISLNTSLIILWIGAGLITWVFALLSCWRTDGEITLRDIFSMAIYATLGPLVAFFSLLGEINDWLNTQERVIFKRRARHGEAQGKAAGDDDG